MTCRCNCGYKCGGPGKCDLGFFECMDKHWVRDCDHDFTGPWVEFKFPEGGSEGGVSCTKCGMYVGHHDMMVGP